MVLGYCLQWDHMVLYINLGETVVMLRLCRTSYDGAIVSVRL